MLWLIFACSMGKESPTFGAGGTIGSNGIPDEVDDTADGGTDDTGAAFEGDEGAPDLGTLTASFEDVPNVGTVLYVYISFVDENDSLVGGTVYATFTDSGDRTKRALVAAAKIDGFGFPTTVVIDRSGAIRGLWNGYGPGDERRLQSTIEAALRDP